jgi:outer membrane protein
MAQKAVAIAEKDVSIAKSDFYPKINAEGGLSTQGDTFKAAGSENLPDRCNEWSFNLTGEWTAFSSGTTFYGVRAAKQSEYSIC